MIGVTVTINENRTFLIQECKKSKMFQMKATDIFKIRVP